MVLVPDLPRLDRQRIRAAASLASLSDYPEASSYAKATNLASIHAFKAMDSYSRHYCGTIIRKTDGTPWGVLLVDSEEDQCPFPVAGGGLQDRLADLARIIGRIV